MAAYLIRRFLLMLLTLFGISVLVCSHLLGEVEQLKKEPVPAEELERAPWAARSSLTASRARAYATASACP